MKLEDTDYDNSETGCCAKLDVARWDGRELNWQDKPFLKDHIRNFLHIPLNFGSVITRDHELVQQAQAYPREPLWLTDEVSPWGSDIYLALDRELADAEVVTMSGRFLCKVFEGPYRNVGSWTQEMQQYVSEQGLELRKLYYYYATCPKCAKRLGANHVVLFAEVQ